ncbi:seipin [Toxorhynchites rutilus septentrionalis]|uniref:seipin n=1 Tax=Toxorhynchites rutilus septentrionalis TaxID=329112 RepID=UPI002479D85B|nr:seipin [Toxorhynchites rutilus septentrionalis]
MKIGNLILSILDPFKIIRNYLLKPLAVTGIVFAEEYRRKTSAGAKLTKNVVLKLIVLVLLGLSVVWASIFMYAYFYYTYMPTVSHIQDVHLSYRDCSSEKECLQYPTDTVILTKNQQLLMVGQPYRVILHIEMPESEQNDKTGMFTVCGTMHDHLYEFSMKSCRLTMIHYKSGLLKMLSTIFLTPFLILGYREEKQTVSVELFTHFEDSQAHPATSVDIRILSRDIQFYSAQLHITANFSGLRYLMFNWPVLSALIGIISNLFFIVIVCILSWYHWDDTEWIVEIKGKYQQIVGRAKAIEGPKQPEKLLGDDKKIYEIDEISGFKEDIDLTN